MKELNDDDFKKLINLSKGNKYGGETIYPYEYALEKINDYFKSINLAVEITEKDVKLNKCYGQYVMTLYYIKHIVSKYM